MYEYIILNTIIINKCLGLEKEGYCSNHEIGTEGL